MKAISVSDRDFEIEQQIENSLVHIDGKLVKGSDETQVARKQIQLDTLQNLSVILMEYDKLQKPKDKVFALLAFEADYIIKSYLDTPIDDDDTTLHSGKHVKDNMNEIPEEIVSVTFLIIGLDWKLHSVPIPTF
jgi:hypothetical protein